MVVGELVSQSPAINVGLQVDEVSTSKLSTSDTSRLMEMEVGEHDNSNSGDDSMLDKLDCDEDDVQMDDEEVLQLRSADEHITVDEDQERALLGDPADIPPSTESASVQAASHPQLLQASNSDEASSLPVVADDKDPSSSDSADVETKEIMEITLDGDDDVREIVNTVVVKPYVRLPNNQRSGRVSSTSCAGSVTDDIDVKPSSSNESIPLLTAELEQPSSAVPAAMDDSSIATDLGSSCETASSSSFSAVAPVVSIPIKTLALPQRLIAHMMSICQQDGVCASTVACSSSTSIALQSLQQKQRQIQQELGDIRVASSSQAQGRNKADDGQLAKLTAQLNQATDEIAKRDAVIKANKLLIKKQQDILSTVRKAPVVETVIEVEDSPRRNANSTKSAVFAKKRAPSSSPLNMKGCFQPHRVQGSPQHVSDAQHAAQGLQRPQQPRNMIFAAPNVSPVMTAGGTTRQRSVTPKEVMQPQQSHHQSSGPFGINCSGNTRGNNGHVNSSADLRKMVPQQSPTRRNRMSNRMSSSSGTVGSACASVSIPVINVEEDKLVKQPTTPATVSLSDADLRDSFMAAAAARGVPPPQIIVAPMQQHHTPANPPTGQMIQANRPAVQNATPLPTAASQSTAVAQATPRITVQFPMLQPWRTITPNSLDNVDPLDYPPGLKKVVQGGFHRVKVVPNTEFFDFCRSKKFCGEIRYPAMPNDGSHTVRIYYYVESFHKDWIHSQTVMCRPNGLTKFALQFDKEQPLLVGDRIGIFAYMFIDRQQKFVSERSLYWLRAPVGSQFPPEFLANQ